MSIQYGDWEIIRIIGSGAFGTVYEIKRETLGFMQTAALKVISVPQSQSDVDRIRSTGMDEASIGEYYKDLASQIMSELRTMEQLKGHSNIVSYEDHEIRRKENGIGWDLYIRMELLTPLSKYMLSHSMSQEEIIRLGIDLCCALERCESLNLIHRDIKPDNIFVSKMGDGKLGDFGIARTVERTMSGLSQKGTYGYMAPEVYLGKPYGKTVDIYSLGLVLYKLLNFNRGPFLPAYPNPIRFQDQEQALVRRIRGEQLPAPAQADGRLAEVVLKACSANPEQRYATAGEMRTALQAVTENAGRKIVPAARDAFDGLKKTFDINRETSSILPPVSEAEMLPQQEQIKQNAGVPIYADTPFLHSEQNTGNCEQMPETGADNQRRQNNGVQKKRSSKRWIVLGLAAIFAVFLCVGLFLQSLKVNEKDAEIFADDLMKVITGKDVNTIDPNRYYDIESAEELNGLLERRINQMIDQVVEEEGDIILTDEEKTRFKELLLKAGAKVKYSIGEAVKTEEGFEVPVTIEPFLFLNGASEGIGEVICDFIKQEGVENINTAEFAHLFLRKRMDNIEKNLGTESYGTPLQKTIYIKRNERKYDIVPESVTEIGEVLLSDEEPAPETTTEDMVLRTEKLLASAASGELDGSLEPLDIIVAAFYYNGIQKYLDQDAADETIYLVKYLDEAGRRDYRSFWEQAYAMERYEILSAEEKDEGYEVTIKKSSPDIQALYDKADEEAAAYAKTLDISSFSTDEEFYRVAYREEMNLLLAGLNNVEYKEPEVYSVKYYEQENGTYDVDQDSVIQLLSA